MAATTTNSPLQEPISFEIGSPLFYIVVGAGSIMSVLLFIILILCVAIGCLASKRRRTYAFTAQPPPATHQLNQNEERQIPDQQQQVQNHSNISGTLTNNSLQGSYGNIITNPEYDTMADNERGAEPMYAVIDDSKVVQHPIPVVVPIVIEERRRQVHLQPQREAVPAKQVVLGRSKSYPDNLSLQKVKHEQKRPDSWPSLNLPIRNNTTELPVNVDEKMLGVYDAIAPPTSKAKTREDGGLEYNKLSYMGYPKRKLAYPSHDSSVLASMYSRLNVDINPPHNATWKMAPSIGGVPGQNQMVNIQETTSQSDKRAKAVDKRVQKEFQMSPCDGKDSPSSLYSNVNEEVNNCSTKCLPTPVYSVPDMKKKKREGWQVRELPPRNVSPPPSPIYTNLNAERNKACGPSSQPAPVYSVPDMEKKWESRRIMSQHGHKGQRKTIEQTVQMRALPPRHQTVSSSPLYSNLDDERGLVQSTPVPVHSVPDMEMESNPPRDQGTSELWIMKSAQQRHEDYPMKELPSQNEASPLYSNVNAELSSSALYSNVNAEMHPVRITSSQKAAPVYSVPDKSKKRRNMQALKEQDDGSSQLPLCRDKSPSPPPLPLPLITESTGERTTFDVSEPLYPHVSVPFRLMTVKPMPTDSSHGYDCPKRKDIYKPLPLEGFYDVPNKPEEFTDVTGIHYDLPKSLSVVAASKSCETRLKSDIGDEYLERLEQSSMQEEKMSQN